MFTSKSHNTATTSTNSGGLLSRLRSSNKPAGTKAPVYNTSSRNNRTTSANTGLLGGVKKTGRRKKTVATGPAPVSHHATKPTMGQKVHGAATVVSGKIHNDHREVRQGEKEMHGQSSGLFSSSGQNSKRV